MKYIDRRCDFEVINYNEWTMDRFRWTPTKKTYIPFAPLKCDFEKFTCASRRSAQEVSGEGEN